MLTIKEKMEKLYFIKSQRGGGMGEMGKTGEREWEIQASSSETSKPWGGKIQHRGYSPSDVG